MYYYLVLMCSIKDDGNDYNVNESSVNDNMMINNTKVKKKSSKGENKINL